MRSDKILLTVLAAATTLLTETASAQGTMSLSDAATAVEQATGGRVMEIGVQNRNGQESYEAIVAKGDAVLATNVDPSTRQVTNMSDAIPASAMSHKMRRFVRSIQKARMPIADAIRATERYARGPLVRAKIAKPLGGDNAVLAYEVTSPNFIRHPFESVEKYAGWDAENGARIANPQALHESWGPAMIFHKRRS